MQNSAAWLKTFQEPWDMVLTKWEQTFPLRKKCKTTTVAEFFEQWPILKHKEAYTLVCYYLTKKNVKKPNLLVYRFSLTSASSIPHVKFRRY